MSSYNARVPADQQLQLIMECRNSGLSDYQWCKEPVSYTHLKLLLEKQPNNRMSDEELECFTPWNPEVKALLGSRVTDELENG